LELLNLCEPAWIARVIGFTAAEHPQLWQKLKLMLHRPTLQKIGVRKKHLVFSGSAHPQRVQRVLLQTCPTVQKVRLFSANTLAGKGF
jgi:hypothetical protein